jgi:putative transposase
MAIKTMKYRLYPSSAQRTAMQSVLDACRWVYNKTLEVRKEAWEEREESLSLYDTNKMLTQWKRDEPWLSQAFSQSLQEAQERVDLAFKHFFRRCQNGDKPGYPRFKGDWYKSFTYKQAWNGFGLSDDGKRLRLSKVGWVKIVLHRPIEGEVKRLHIKRDALGNWWACFVVEFEPEPLEPTHKTVGIDLGCKHFATLSDGTQIDNPRFFRKDEKALAKAQRKLSECDKGTPEYRKRKRVVEHIHQRIANRRKDFAHKLSRRLVNEYQFIAFEALDIQGMQEGNWRSLNKSISDAAWGQLVRLTQVKAEWAGRTVVTVDPRNTSQMCSGCGKIVKKPLSERVHKCPHCNLEIDRDWNAALNILGRGLASLGESPRSPLL